MEKDEERGALQEHHEGEDVPHDDFGTGESAVEEGDGGR